MFKSYKFRLYPTKTQEVLLNKHFGAVRFIYNLGLEVKQIAYTNHNVNLSGFDLINQIPNLKKDLTWLTEIGSNSLQQSIIDLDKAYTSFYKKIGNYPCFKKKSEKGSFRIPTNVNIVKDKLTIPKFKEGIKMVQSKELKGTIKSATISKTPTGKYYVSILVDTLTPIPNKVPINPDKAIGIDLGLIDFLTTSKADKVSNPKFLKKSLSKLKYTQSKYSKYKGKRTLHKYRLLHEKIANQRKDFLQKLSTSIIKNHDTICLETLKVENMIKNHKLAQAIGDVSWSEFNRMLEYKAEWYGKNIIRIGQFEPSSKICSNCGATNRTLTLSDRIWDCKSCNTTHDRDINAAINIKNFALKNYIVSGVDTQNQEELPTLVGVMTLGADNNQ
jgi:putative transposase